MMLNIKIYYFWIYCIIIFERFTCNKENYFSFLHYHSFIVCIINKIHCKMSDFNKTYKLSRSLIKKEFNFLIIHSFTFNSLHFNDFASQDSWNINQIFVEKKWTLQEVINRIHHDTFLLILRENNQYIEWSSDINAQFQQWWLQMFINESIINKI